jgi:hypothetical protein
MPRMYGKHTQRYQSNDIKPRFQQDPEGAIDEEKSDEAFAFDLDYMEKDPELDAAIDEKLGIEPGKDT